MLQNIQDLFSQSISFIGMYCFSGVISGALIIETPDREPITLGTVSPDTQAPKIQVRNEFFWLRVVLFGDLGFSESYLLDEISTTDLTAVFEFFIHNNAAVSTPTTLGLFSSLFSNIFRRTINNRADGYPMRYDAAIETRVL
ncbi:hypothetical protein VM1G_12051 [Cytospora mali]|uniref:Uncharacterized protein n=1 Tax=Cytospora mali TaxID=578113 RepID=A0A194VJP8_CYTMA|nr:hypothetical protein VM1G_12051 [Valsa mali]